MQLVGLELHAVVGVHAYDFTDQRATYDGPDR